MTINYQSATAKPVQVMRLMILYFTFLVVNAIVMGILWAYLFFRVEAFKEVYRDFGTTLPIATRYLISISDALHDLLPNVFLLVILFLLPLLPAFLIGRSRSEARSQVMVYTLLVTLIWLIAGVVVFMVIQYVAQLPLFKLMQSLSGSPPSP